MDEGAHLGPYELIKRIGIGGMAEIYLARTTGIGGFEKFLALKVIHPRFVQDQEFIDMLIDEAKIAVQLNHVNVAQIFDLGCIDGMYFIAMEFVDGKDVYQLMLHCADEGIPIPFEVVAFIGMEMASGLHYAHHKCDPTGEPLNLVHRDVSPQNVLLSYEGQVKLVDFGIAKASQRRQQTESGVIKGKFHYMSPEQAWGDSVDGRSDIFSTGICLYEMVTGEMLYNEERPLVLLDRVRRGAVPSIRERRPDIPKALENIIMKALAREREDRFDSAGDLQGALSSFLYGHWPSFARRQVGEFIRNAFDPNAEKTPQKAPLSRPEQGDEDNEGIMHADEFDHTHGQSVIFALSDIDKNGGRDRLNQQDDDDGDQTIAGSYVVGLGSERLERSFSADDDIEDAEPWDDGGEKTQILDSVMFEDAPESNASSEKVENSSNELPTSVFDVHIGHEGFNPSATVEDDYDLDATIQPGKKPARRQTAGTAPEPSPIAPPPERRAPTRPRAQAAPQKQAVQQGDTDQDSKDKKRENRDGARAPKASPPKDIKTPTVRRSKPTPAAQGTQKSHTFAKLLTVLKTPAGVTVIALFLLTLYAVATFLPTAVAPQKIPAKLVLSSVPPGASIIVDGQDTGRLTNAQLEGYNVGEQHVIKVILKGYEPQVKSITLNGESLNGQPVEIQRRFFLRRSRGQLNVESSPPGAEIYLDGRYVGVTPTVIRNLERQKDQMLVHLKKNGYRSKKITLSWGEKDRLNFSASLEPTSK